MLFNSYPYILLFLPAALAGFFLLNRKSFELSKFYLILTSLFFYAYWNPHYLILILILLLANYGIGHALTEERGLSPRSRKSLLIFGITLNLSVLGFYKYADFLIENVNQVCDTSLQPLNITLPLAISFFTFQKIAFLVDAFKGLVGRMTFTNFILFVLFFPQLIAGPIVHSQEIFPQLQDKKNGTLNWNNCCQGLFLFLIGLFKKGVMADSLAVWASAGFDSAKHLHFIEAWFVSLAYTLQLYFDFSGYTDMALGAALMFNIRLPLNFNSPYRSLNIQDFWRRWHITLGRFLKNHLYIPLGGNRSGESRMLAALFTTFLLGGIWHGAAWTFVIWGALHGLAMVAFRLWRKGGFSIPSWLAWMLTFGFVNVSWVFFRAENFSDALKVLRGMFGFEGFVWPRFHVDLFSGCIQNNLFKNILASNSVILWVLGCLLVALFGTNSQTLASRFRPNLPHLAFAVGIGVLGILSLTQVKQFLYFNF